MNFSNNEEAGKYSYHLSQARKLIFAGNTQFQPENKLEYFGSFCNEKKATDFGKVLFHLGQLRSDLVVEYDGNLFKREYNWSHDTEKKERLYKQEVSNNESTFFFHADAYSGIVKLFVHNTQRGREFRMDPDYESEIDDCIYNKQFIFVFHPDGDVQCFSCLWVEFLPDFMTVEPDTWMAQHVSFYVFRAGMISITKTKMVDILGRTSFRLMDILPHIHRTPFQLTGASVVIDGNYLKFYLNGIDTKEYRHAKAVHYIKKMASTNKTALLDAFYVGDMCDRKVTKFIDIRRLTQVKDMALSSACKIVGDIDVSPFNDYVNIQTKRFLHAGCLYYLENVSGDADRDQVEALQWLNL